MAAAQLAREDFLVGLDRQRADVAGQVLAPVPGLSSTTAAGLVRKFTDGQWRAVETGIDDIHTAMLAALGPARTAALCDQVSIDLDTIDVEVVSRCWSYGLLMLAMSTWQQALAWSAMNVEPVLCACGNPVSGGGDDIASVLLGPMCDACIRIARHQAGRLCDRCIHRLNTQYPGVQFAVGNQHPLAHSHVLDTCVDRAILPFLEGFNQNVAPTFSSCQGVDMLPGRPGRWVQEPFIVVHGPHQPAVTAWAQRTADRYRISAVRVHNEGDPYHRVVVDFADTPMTWLG